MMSRPDFMSKQVLFIESTDLDKLRFKNSNLVLEDNDKNILLQHSLHKIFIVFIYGECTITSVLIKNSKKFSLSFIFLNYNLKCYHSIIPDNKGNFLLRKKQYCNKTDLDIAKRLIFNKISNQIFLLKSLKYISINEKLIISNIELLLEKVNLINVSQELLGVEGNASKLYFEVYFKNLEFKGRKPRCKTDIFNLLLDIGYFYLFNFIDSNLELYGFDTYYGVYHKLFYQRKSLVCDIIEPFRCIIDKNIKKGYNLKQINNNDFYFKNGQYYLKKDFNKKYSEFFLKEILKYKEDIFLYIQLYYRAFMKEKKIENYPFFKIGDY
jgi:CRISPR-associated protein Cas1